MGFPPTPLGKFGPYGKIRGPHWKFRRGFAPKNFGGAFPPEVRLEEFYPFYRAF